MPHLTRIAVVIACFQGSGTMMQAEEASLPKFRAKYAAHQPVKVVCLGDSVTGIYYHTGGRRAYPEMVEVGLKRIDPKAQVTVINAGVSGNATDAALARLQRDVLDHKPDLVTVMFGLNDIVRIPQPDFLANLKTIIDRCRAGGSEVMLCTENGIFETPGRPISKLEEYNQAMKSLGEETQTPFCDVYAAYQAVRAKQPLEFRLLCSDEFHPNMNGHKLNAETICRAITGKTVSLKEVGPPVPPLPKTEKQLAANQPVRVFAMPPYDEWIGSALKSVTPRAQVEVTRWETKGQTLSQLHAASKTVRQLSPKPDLVIVAIPLEITPPLSKPEESDIAAHSWILNFALSFGLQEWDVIAVTPSVLHSKLSAADQDRDAFSRKMIFAQDINMMARPPENTDEAQMLFERWFKK